MFTSCFADGAPDAKQLQAQLAGASQDAPAASLADEGTSPIPAKTLNQIANLKYIPVNSFNATNSISVKDISDFSTLIVDYKINHVFYNNNIFFIQNEALPVPASIASNSYKSISDYQKGKDIGFKDGTAYYYAVDNKLNTQEEVDYYKHEKFFSSADYRQAQKDGFVKFAAPRMNKITGIIKKSDLEKNIYFANAIIYFLYYQSTDLVKSFLDNKDVVALTLPFTGVNTNRNNYSSNNIIVEFKGGYYYINLDISALGVQSDAVFYYACKFAQYLNNADYLAKYSSGNNFSIKNSDIISKNDLKYPSYLDCINDINGLLGRR
jgi:hypothetical protein